MRLKNRILFLLLLVVKISNGQQAPIIKFKDLNSILNRKTDTLYVINFWATWCDPCVHELTDFLKLENELSEKKVKFHFVSLDFKRDYDSQFLPFLQKHSMDKFVYLLDEPDYNSWIDKVNPKWKGSIPTTIIISHNPDSIDFNEGELNYESLARKIKSHIH